jgi:putative zinc finger protein
MNDEHSDLLAELALGALSGRERAATLAHVESCPRCAEELEQLSRAADAVLQVAPDVEPPLGFEVRLLDRMGVDATPNRSSVPMRWALAAAAAMVVLGVGLGIGLTGGSSPAGHPTQAVGPTPKGALVDAADLRLGGEKVGRVFTYGGSTPWMFMTLADSTARGRVTCEVITTDGVLRKVGTFTAKKGYGAWGAPLPVAPQDVRTAEVVSSDGAVVATATLR